MALDKTSLKHCIEDIHRQVADEYPELSLIIIPYNAQKSKDDIETACAPYAQHPAIAPLKAALENSLSQNGEKSELVGIAQAKEKILLSLFAKTFSVTAIWLKADACESTDEVCLEIYRQVFRIFKILRAFKSQKTDNLKSDNGVHSLKPFGAHTARTNLEADAFAAIMFEQTRKSGMIRELAKIRCDMSFDRLSVFEADQYPYPVALDATQLVFNDVLELLKQQHYKDGIIERAAKMTDEVSLTCTDNIIAQWQEFVKPAQEMMLSGSDIRQIMGAAVYTSENAYNSSIAYLVCDILGTEPAPVANFEGYNPFADTDAQERIHKKLREESFQTASEKDDLTYEICMQSAHSGCWHFLNGNPIGWCAPAWIAIAKHLKENGNKITKQDAKAIFDESNKEMDWLHVRTLHKGLLDYRRQNKFPTLNTIAELLRREEGLREVALDIKNLNDLFEKE